MARTSFRDRNPLIVGVAGLAVLSLAVTVSFLTGTLGLLKDRYTMTGVFADTGGLRSGHEVEVAGVAVGEVTEVKPDFRNGRVLVTWKVDHNVDLGPRTRAEIRMSNILGGRYLRLSGPVGEPYMADVSDDRRRIPLERTATPITFNDLLNEGTGTLSKLDAKAVSAVLDQLRDVSEQGRGRLGGALQNLTALAEAVNESDPQIRRVLADGDRLIRLVNAKDAQLSQLARNAGVLLGQLRDRQAELSVLLGSGDRTVQSLSRLISAKQSELVDIINELDTTMTTFEPRMGDLNQTLAWSGPTMAGFVDTGVGGPWFNAIFTQLGPLGASDLQALTGMLQSGRKAPQ
jgi:phospholipid/cholesterol/gamma-HCH transport system substrate-binding protein